MLHKTLLVVDSLGKGFGFPVLESNFCFLVCLFAMLKIFTMYTHYFFNGRMLLISKHKIKPETFGLNLDRKLFLLAHILPEVRRSKFITEVLKHQRRDVV
jgi:hypothetical protein